MHAIESTRTIKITNNDQNVTEKTQNFIIHVNIDEDNKQKKTLKALPVQELQGFNKPSSVSSAYEILSIPNPKENEPTSRLVLVRKEGNIEFYETIALEGEYSIAPNTNQFLVADTVQYECHMVEKYNDNKELIDIETNLTIHATNKAKKYDQIMKALREGKKAAVVTNAEDKSYSVVADRKGNIYLIAGPKIMKSTTYMTTYSLDEHKNIIDENNQIIIENAIAVLNGPQETNLTLIEQAPEFDLLYINENLLKNTFQVTGKSNKPILTITENVNYDEELTKENGGLADSFNTEIWFEAPDAVNIEDNLSAKLKNDLATVEKTLKMMTNNLLHAHNILAHASESNIDTTLNKIIQLKSRMEAHWKKECVKIVSQDERNPLLKDNFVDQKAKHNDISNAIIELISLGRKVQQAFHHIQWIQQQEAALFLDVNIPRPEAMKLDKNALRSLKLEISKIDKEATNVAGLIRVKYQTLSQCYNQLNNSLEEPIKRIKNFIKARFTKDDNNPVSEKEIVSFEKQERLARAERQEWEKNHKYQVLFSSFKSNLYRSNQNPFGPKFEFVTIASQKQFLDELVETLYSIDNLPQSERKSSIFHSMGSADVGTIEANPSYINAKKYLFDIREKLAAIKKRVEANQAAGTLEEYDFLTETINEIRAHLNAANTGWYGESPALSDDIKDSTQQEIKGGYLFKFAEIIWSTIAASQQYAAIQENGYTPLGRLEASEICYLQPAETTKYPAFGSTYKKKAEDAPKDFYGSQHPRSSYVLAVRQMVGEFAETALAYQRHNEVLDFQKQQILPAETQTSNLANSVK